MCEFINKNIILYVCVLILIQCLISHLIFYKRENFTPDAAPFQWTSQLLFDFLTIQKLINPGIVFDTNIIKQQVSTNEMKFFFQNKYFYWSDDTKQKYMVFINNNPSIRSFANDALNKAQTIYNENAILQLLYTQSKEGKFLIYGRVPSTTAKTEYAYGYNSGLQSENERFVCGENKNKEFLLQKIVNTQNEFGLTETKVTDLNNNDLENEISGFKFLKDKCNPCLNLIDNKKCEFLIL